MDKLHALLAIESNLRGQTKSTLDDLRRTFMSKGHHFTKKVVTVKPLDENKPVKTESQLDLQTTVEKELSWIGQKISKTIDLGFQIDAANVIAKSDVILDDGTIILTGVPATALLRLEHRLGEIKSLVESIPTLDPAKGFLPDPAEGSGIFKAVDEERTRTEKVFDFKVMVPATDKHPAQVKELMLDKPVATVVTQEWSSLITVSTKASMLDRVEELIRAVKKAQSRANDVEIDSRQNKIGSKLFDYVVSGAK